MASSKDFNKIVLAVDGSDISKKAAKKAFSLAKKIGINATVIHVVNFPIYAVYTADTAYMGDINSSLKKYGNNVLNEIVNMGSVMGIKVKKKLVEGVPDDEIIKIAQPDDLIWVHDYHLMLLPKLIREKIPDALIGFFLHIPFPSFEIFVT